MSTDALTTNTREQHVRGCSCVACSTAYGPHGSRKRYDNGCSCAPCLTTHTTRHREQRAARYARRVRVSIDGVWRLVAAHLPPEKHGRPGTRGNWGCECPSCRATQSERCKGYNTSR